MAPRTGRPPSENPKTLNTRIRLSEEDVQKLDYCQKVFQVSKAEVIRGGIDEMFKKAKEKEK